MQYIVEQGDVRPLTDRNHDWHRRDNYGADWIVVDATSEADALMQAGQYDAGTHPAQTEMALFAAAYRAGALALPGETATPETLHHWMTTEQVADVLGVTTGRIRQLARLLHVGTTVGRGRLYSEADIGAMRQRQTRPGPRQTKRAHPEG